MAASGKFKLKNQAKKGLACKRNIQMMRGIFSTQEESYSGGTAVEVYSAATLLSTLMSQWRQLPVVRHRW